MSERLAAHRGCPKRLPLVPRPSRADSRPNRWLCACTRRVRAGSAPGTTHLAPFGAQVCDALLMHLQANMAGFPRQATTALARQLAGITCHYVSWPAVTARISGTGNPRVGGSSPPLATIESLRENGGFCGFGVVGQGGQIGL